MAAQRCDFFGCEREVPGDYPWQMCEPCYDMACEWDDSELDDLNEVAP